MSLAFLTARGPAAESPIAALLAERAATFERRGGWSVATSVGSPQEESHAIAASVGWADLSHLTKHELSSGGPGERGRALAIGGALWCWISDGRRLLLRESAEHSNPIDAVDVTTQLGAIALGGPLAREVIARFCALDLRPSVAPAGSFLPGSVARTPGYVLVASADRYLLLFGAAFSEYLWTVVSDAGEHLGGRVVGADATGPLLEPGAGTVSHA